MNILVVDDSKLIRNILDTKIRQVFKDAKIFQASDGNEALKILKANSDINCMFTDWNMPHMNGLDLVKAVRAESRFADLKIIMATAEGDKAKVIQAVQVGIDGYIVKPFQPEALQKVLEKLSLALS